VVAQRDEKIWTQDDQVISAQTAAETAPGTAGASTTSGSHTMKATGRPAYRCVWHWTHGMRLTGRSLDLLALLLLLGQGHPNELYRIFHHHHENACPRPTKIGCRSLVRRRTRFMIRVLQISSVGQRTLRNIGGAGTSV
jgi:hypothetical protein